MTWEQLGRGTFSQDGKPMQTDGQELAYLEDCPALASLFQLCQGKSATILGITDPVVLSVSSDSSVLSILTGIRSHR